VTRTFDVLGSTDPTGLDGWTSADLVREFPGLVAVVSLADGDVIAISQDLEAAVRRSGTGDPTALLADFVTDDVRAALQRAVDEGTTIRVEQVPVVVQAVAHYVDLTIRPLGRAGELELLLVRLDDTTELVASRGAADDARADYESAEQRHRELFELTTLGVVYQDLDGIIRDANPAALEILGAAALEDIHGRDSADPLWHAVDRDGQPFRVEDHPPMVTLRTGRPTVGVIVGVDRVDGTERRWLRITANPRFDRNGELIGVFSLFEDITMVRRLEALNAELQREHFGTQLRRAMEAMHDSVVIGSPVLRGGDVVDFRVEYFTGELHARPTPEYDELVGRTFSDAWPELVPTGLLTRYLEVLRTGVAVRIGEVDFAAYEAPAVQIADISAAAVDGQLVVVWRDVTERVEQERQLREAERMARLARWALDGDGELFVSTAAPRVLGAADREAAIRTLRPTVDRLVARRDGAGGSVEFSVESDGGPLDVCVSAYADGSGWRGTLQDVTSIRRVERALAHERESVDLLQRAVMPEAVGRFDGFDVGARFESATGDVLVGGDWFDVVVLPDSGCFAVIVGDVAGHGLAAAQTMVQLRHWARLLCMDSDTPSHLLRRLNSATCRFMFGEMATALVAFVDGEAGELEWASAGHPPLARRRNGSAEIVYHEKLGCPLGVSERWDGRDQREPLAGVDVVVAYTDGLVERRNESLDDGFDRLAGVLGSGQLEAQGWCDRLMSVLRHGSHASDDACVVVLRPDGGHVDGDLRTE
jgi:PAS domain S-box-containing protein